MRNLGATWSTPKLWDGFLEQMLRASTTQGYTGHEMAESVGIIHMGGRIYDARLGRFLQADPFVQSPHDLQSWNRYSYALNNPLLYTDPSGYLSVGDALRVVAAVAITVYSGGAAAGAWSYFGASIAAGSAQAYAVVAVGGFAAGAVQTGTLKGAVTGAVSAGVFYGIGTAFSQANASSAWEGDRLSWSGYAAKTLSHGAAGGVMAELQGGSFGHGFASAGFGEAVSPTVADIGSVPAQAIAVSVVGGTASVLAGGKFGNGAVTAAFGFAFNRLSHESSGSDIALTSDEEALLIKLRGEFPRSDSATESNLRILKSGSVTDVTTHGCNSYSCAFTTEQINDSRIVFHQHNVYDGANLLAREWPSGGDVTIVRHGVVNVMLSPAGAIRVVEKIDSGYAVRTIYGGNSRLNGYISRTWRPDMSDSQIADAAKGYKGRWP